MTHATHPNATLTPTGRLRLARLVVVRGWTLARAAERFSVSITTARRWVDRYREHGAAGMGDRSSRPRRSPGRLPRRTERRIVGLRVARRWGPARIAYHLGLNPSTVHKVLHRYRCPRLKWTDPATGTRTKTSRADKRSYVHAAPGDLVHVDIKKLGRIPDGGGWRIHGRGSAQDRRAGAARDKAARAGAPGRR
jgi:transposase-like protein